MPEQDTLIRPTKQDVDLPVDFDEQPVRRIRLTLSSVLATIVFSAIELWAVIVVLTMLRVDGVLKVALCCALAGALMAIYLAWQGLRAEAVGDEYITGSRRRGRT
jgi:hypothetical protein